MLATLLTCATLAAAPPVPKHDGPASLDSVVAPIVKDADIPALAVAVLDADRLVAIGAAGVRKRGEPEPVRADDRFHLGSCTKAMTATLCALLVEEGSLRWESTVGDMLGAIAPHMDESWRPVTLEELLRHCGGAPASVAPEIWEVAWKCTGAPEECRAAFVNEILRAPIAQPRGTFAYSNQGYAIAGRMAEVATGKTWETLMRERLFAPLDMKSAGFGVPSKSAPNGAPSGHGTDGRPNDIDNPPAIGPAGIVHASLEDWSKFVRLHLRAEPSAAIPISAANYARLQRGSPESAPDRALGWMVTSRPWAGENGSGRVLTHAGSNNLWFCVAWLAPDRDFAVLAACNQGGPAAERACDQAASAAIGWYLRERNEADRTAEPTSPSPPSR